LRGDYGAFRSMAAMVDEPTGEVVAVQERAVAGEEGDVGLERVTADGVGVEGGGQVVNCHGPTRIRS
jgi:hypothetical protein